MLWPCAGGFTLRCGGTSCMAARARLLCFLPMRLYFYDWIINTWQMTTILNRTFLSTSIKYKQCACVSICVSASGASSHFELGRGEQRLFLMAWGKIYGARQPLGMQRGDRGDCFHIIVPSSSSQRYAFVCRAFFFPSAFLSLCSSVCIFVWLCRTSSARERGTQRGEKMKYIELMSANLCLKGGRRAMGESQWKWNTELMTGLLFLCVSLCVCPRVHLTKFTLARESWEWDQRQTSLLVVSIIQQLYQGS